MLLVDRLNFRKANQAFREKRYVDAILAYRNAIKITPSFYHYYLNLSYALVKIRMLDSGSEIFHLAMKLHHKKITASECLYRTELNLQDFNIHKARLGYLFSGKNSSATSFSTKIFSVQVEKISIAHVGPLSIGGDRDIASSQHHGDDRFLLYRILGNDLSPRHKNNQTVESLAFILKNEPNLDRCDKRWIVNRVFDQAKENEIIKLLENHNASYFQIPFNPQEYRNISWDYSVLPHPNFLGNVEFQKESNYNKNRILFALYRLKNLYVMNNNGARNAALRDGRFCAKWILPLDGNCFFTAHGWQAIFTAIANNLERKYFVIPMSRVLDNTAVLYESSLPNAVDEPQLMFRSDSTEEFDENLPYGRRPKVELLKRLGVPGPWDEWRDDRWDQPSRPLSVESDQFGYAGWVYRLFSGNAEQEGNDALSMKKRAQARQNAIFSTINEIDELLQCDPLRLFPYKKVNV